VGILLTVSGTIGLRQSLVLAAAGELVAAAWLWFSPLRGIQDLAEDLAPDGAA